MSFDVVIPTIGRPSLVTLLRRLDAAPALGPGRVILVDDRRRPRGALLSGDVPPDVSARITILRSRGAGPAAARNIGWRASEADCDAKSASCSAVGSSCTEVSAISTVRPRATTTEIAIRV